MSKIWHKPGPHEAIDDKTKVSKDGKWVRWTMYGWNIPGKDAHDIGCEWAYLDDLLALETELAKYKKQVKKLREQNRTLTESLGEYFNRWMDANIQAIKDKDQIRVLTEQEQARHQLIIDQLKGLK